MDKRTIDNGTWLGRMAMQIIKERIAILSGAAEHSICDSADLSSIPTSAQLTTKNFGSHQDVLKLHAMSKIDI